jgi:hypothetical protein
MSAPSGTRAESLKRYQPRRLEPFRVASRRHSVDGTFRTQAAQIPSGACHMRFNVRAYGQDFGVVQRAPEGLTESSQL